MNSDVADILDALRWHCQYHMCGGFFTPVCLAPRRATCHRLMGYDFWCCCECHDFIEGNHIPIEDTIMMDGRDTNECAR